MPGAADTPGQAFCSGRVPGICLSCYHPLVNPQKFERTPRGSHEMQNQSSGSWSSSFWQVLGPFRLGTRIL